MKPKPLTKKEIAVFKRNFLEVFDKKYAETLASSALPIDWTQPHSHLAAKFAIIRAAEGFNVFDRVSKSEFKNMCHFV